LTNTVERVATEKRAQFRKVAPVLRQYAASAAKVGLTPDELLALNEQLAALEAA